VTQGILGAGQPGTLRGGTSGEGNRGAPPIGPASFNKDQDVVPTAVLAEEAQICLHSETPRIASVITANIPGSECTFENCVLAILN